jgi:SAM-dependent methyltransferase
VADLEVRYGPNIAGEDELRLLGPVSGKRVLLLGSRAPHPFVPLASAGALVVVVEPSLDHLERARAARDAADVRIEMRQGDLADLAFLKAESIDVVLSVGALAEVDDLSRVFRQVHRVLAPGAPFVVSLPHPMAAIVDPAGGNVIRSAFDRGPIEAVVDGIPSTDWGHRTGDLFTTFNRAKLRVDSLLEPQPADGSLVPTTLIVRARKEGS